LKVKVRTAESAGVSVYTAPDTWKMRNSFRKFHAYRDVMFENAGVDIKSELGRYGKTMRPLLDSRHIGDQTDTLFPFTSESDNATVIKYDVGDWGYTQLATTPIYTADATITPEVNWADEFRVYICEENIVQGDTDKESGYYKGVGMIHSYNIDRMEVVTPSSAPGQTLDGPSNPLAALISSGNQATGEVLDIAIGEELEAPPYNIEDAGDSINTPLQGVSVTPSTGGTITINCVAPAGLLRLFFSSTTASSLIEVTVLGKVLAKDMA
jgi:hypothetical protein